MPDPQTTREHVADTGDHGDAVHRADRADRAKMISVRLTSDEYAALSAQATDLGIGASTLARTLIRRGLADRSPASSGLETQIAAHLRATLEPDLASRVEALERWVAEHSRGH